MELLNRRPVLFARLTDQRLKVKLSELRSGKLPLKNHALRWTTDATEGRV